MMNLLNFNYNTINAEKAFVNGSNENELWKYKCDYK